MSWLSKLLGGGDKNAAMNAANQYLDQIPGLAHQGFDPYIQQGQHASGVTQNIYDSLSGDPTAFINKLMEGYKPSEGYQFQKDQLTKEMRNTAAAGGVAGTPMDQLAQAEDVQGLLGKDVQQFLQNLFNVFSIGLKGEEGIASRGFDASKGLTDYLGNNLAAQSGLAYKTATDNKQNNTDMWNMFGKALGSAAGALTGGAPGALIGGGLGSNMFGGG